MTDLQRSLINRPEAWPLPRDAAQSRAVFARLGASGLLFHPEDGAADCLRESGLNAATLAAIDAAVNATFDHLADPCEVALEILNSEA